MVAASTSEALARSRATYQDVLDAPAHQVAEIVAGTLHTHPRPAMPHALAKSIPGRSSSVGPYGKGRGGPGGWWIIDEPELHFGEDILVPDLAGWRRERMPEYPDTVYVTLAPDWVCEVLSASTRRLDLQEKRPNLRPRRRRAPVARRADGPHLGGVRAPRRGVGADRVGEGRRSDQRPAVRCDHLQPGGSLALTRTCPTRMIRVPVRTVERRVQEPRVLGEPARDLARSRWACASACRPLGEASTETHFVLSINEISGKEDWPWAADMFTNAT